MTHYSGVNVLSLHLTEEKARLAMEMESAAKESLPGLGLCDVALQCLQLIVNETLAEMSPRSLQRGLEGKEQQRSQHARAVRQADRERGTSRGRTGGVPEFLPRREEPPGAHGRAPEHPYRLSTE